MKKMRWLPAMLIAGVLAFTACSDDEEAGDVFSPLTEEQHKEKIEQEGVAMVQEMEGIANLQTYDVIDAFIDLMDQSEEQPIKAVELSLSEIQSLKDGPKSTVNYKAMMGDKKRISDEFKAETGIYQWDAEANDWEKIDDSETEATFRFQVDETDAEISVYDVSFKDAANQDEESDMIIELPLSINAHVKLGDETITSFSLNAEWNDDDTPKSIVEVITLEEFSFTSELTNTTSMIAASASFKHNDTVIYANGFTFNGNFDLDEIMDALPEDDGDMDGLFSQAILENANIWFQMGNIKIEGLFDVKGFMEGLADKMQTANEGDDMNDMLVELFNEYAHLYARYADSNEIIAQGELYLSEYTDYGQTYTEPALRMVFGDGSKVSIDEFFETGFGDMISEIEDLLEELETNYDGEAA